jgi:hypothetical protein
MGNDLAFGGKLFVSLGDFCQVAPVLRGASGPMVTLDSSIRSSPGVSFLRGVMVQLSEGFAD